MVRFLVWMILITGWLGAEEVAFVTLSPKGVAKVREGAGRERRRLAPCSTFKIPNSLIGLETGVIPSAGHVLKYDEKRHRTPGFWVEAWGKDHDLESAFRASAVWYFRELAAGVGRGRMQAFLDRFGYGNRDVSGWAETFWIGSSLRISAVEQVEFLDKVFRNEFGLTPASVQALEKMMRQEKDGGRELFYKTGACTDREAGPEVWMVGFVQEGESRTYFAMNAGAATMDEILPRRVELAKERLRRAGLWR